MEKQVTLTKNTVSRNSMNTAQNEAKKTQGHHNDVAGGGAEEVKGVSRAVERIRLSKNLRKCSPLGRKDAHRIWKGRKKKELEKKKAK